MTALCLLVKSTFIPNRDIAALSFRIAGIYALIEAAGCLSYAVSCLTSLPGASAPEERSTFAAFGATYTAIGLFLLLLAYVLAFRNDALAVRMFPSTEPSKDEPRIFGFHAFAYSVVGLAIAIIGFAEFAGALANVIQHRTLTGQVGELIQSVIETGLGIALFFGSHGLVRVWSRLRYSGLRRQMGLCIHCCYDLTGNTSGQCPECGTPLAAPAPPPGASAR